MMQDGDRVAPQQYIARDGIGDLDPQPPSPWAHDEREPADPLRQPGRERQGGRVDRSRVGGSGVVTQPAEPLDQRDPASGQ